LVSWLLLALTSPQVRSFLVSGDGIYTGSIAGAYSYWSSSEKIMTYDWTLLQTLIFIITPFFLMLALTSEDKDDDDMGPGMMTPVTNPT
tara:strand:- start:1547 stop:1813 length:267 start_codon:yes stop_codon:yes gene_type:complete